MTKANFLIAFLIMASTLVQPAIGEVSSCSEISQVDLMAGQYTHVGNVAVCNDADNLYIQVTTMNGWAMTETHLAVEKQLDLIPQNGGGNPKIGLFDYQRTYIPSIQEETYRINLSEAGIVEGDEIYIAVHAVVQLTDEFGNLLQQETAWGDGEEFAGRSWATYFTYTLQSVPTDDSGEGDSGEGDGGIDLSEY